jgi:MGT family glycosyltransferase
VDEHRPDLVMFDAIALWGMMAARVRRIRAAGSMTTLVLDGVAGLRTSRDTLHLIRQGLRVIPAILARRHHLLKTYGPGAFPRRSIFPCTGDFNLVYLSRAFQPDTPFIDGSFHFIGPSILPSARPHVDFPWDALDDTLPLVYISLGTIYHGATGFYRAAFAALGDFPAQFVLSVGHPRHLQGLGPVPSNFIVQSHVPQLELLPRVSAFVTHGGMNSVSEGLYFGIPLVVVPQQFEQAVNGRQVAKAGAGITIGDTAPYGRVDAATLRAVVEHVLREPRYAEGAGRMREACLASGGYRAGASVIESMVAGRPGPPEQEN